MVLDIKSEVRTQLIASVLNAVQFLGLKETNYFIDTAIKSTLTAEQDQSEEEKQKIFTAKEYVSEILLNKEQ